MRPPILESFLEKKDRNVKIAEVISNRRKTKIRLIFARAELKFVKKYLIKSIHIFCSGHRLLSKLMHFFNRLKIVLAMEERILSYKRAVLHRFCVLEYFFVFRS